MSDRPREQNHHDHGKTIASGDSRSRSTSIDRSQRALPRGQAYDVARTEVSAPPSDVRSADLLPPIRIADASDGYQSSTYRSAGVVSLLNPVENDTTGDQRRRKASQMESPAHTTRLPPPALLDPGSRAGSSANSPASTNSTLGDRLPPRRILTPRSPSLHRASSLNQLNAPSATINAQRSPFLVSGQEHTYSIEPGSGGVPPLPAVHVSARSTYGVPSRSSPQTDRRASTGTAQVSRPASTSTSPTSTYSQPEQSSPVHYAATMHYRSDEGLSHSTDNMGMQRDGTHEPQRSVSIPITTSGGSTAFQMMTLSTSSGPVHLPVDVQAASRVADEKRRRNAGASARFRQRRKEKEKESTSTISKLEHQLKEVMDDLAYYKHENQYLTNALRQTPGGERHFPRPSNTVRPYDHPAMSGNLGQGIYQPMIEHDNHNQDQGRNVRRRTSTLSLPPLPYAAQTGLPTEMISYAPHYPAHGYDHQPAQVMGPPGTAPGIPAPTASPANNRGPLPAPTGTDTRQLLHASPQTGPRNPFAHDRRQPPGNASTQFHGNR